MKRHENGTFFLYLRIVPFIMRFIFYSFRINETKSHKRDEKYHNWNTRKTERESDLVQYDSINVKEWLENEKQQTIFWSNGENRLKYPKILENLMTFCLTVMENEPKNKICLLYK